MEVRDSVQEGGRPACFSPVLLFGVVDKRGVLAKGHLYHQLSLCRSEGWRALSHCRRLVYGISEGNDGELSKGRKARVFSPA